MKKTIITGALLIAMIGFNEVNILPTFLSEHIVHADTKIVEDSYFTISNSNSDVYISFREGKLALYATNKNVNSVPGAQITILKENTGRMEGPFNPNTLTIYSKYITQGTNLEVGDKIFIRFLEAFPNCWTGNGNARAKKGETQLYEVKADGALKKLNIDGAGQAQVTYNVNTADPDDPTANPDFTVLIPTKYQLSNKQKVSAGAVALKDAKDVTQNYTGDKAVKVAVTSAKNFQFDNGGTYKLVDGNKADIPAEITLNKTAVSSVVNAQLTKEGSKTASADMLTFNYTVAP